MSLLAFFEQLAESSWSVSIAAQDHTGFAVSAIFLIGRLLAVSWTRVYPTVGIQLLRDDDATARVHAPFACGGAV
jgi:hypothetical protein